MGGGGLSDRIFTLPMTNDMPSANLPQNGVKGDSGGNRNIVWENYERLYAQLLF